MPDRLAVAAVVVVTQTLVEILGMVSYVRLIPRLTPQTKHDEPVNIDSAAHCA